MLIRAATYNIRKAIGLDRRRDPARILDVLAELDADIIALQEADRRFGARISALPHAMLRAHSDYDAVDLGGHADGIGWHGNALLVRRGIRVEAAQQIPLPVLEPRGAVAARLRLDGGQALHVVGMHLDLSGLRRRQQARRIIRHVDLAGDNVPAVIMGDCNEWRHRGGCHDDFARHWRAVDTPRSFHSIRPVARLDRIFTTPGLGVQASGVHDSPLAQRASDHLPVWADISTE